MTVAELIEVLQKLPPDAIVVLTDPHSYTVKTYPLEPDDVEHHPETNRVHL